MAVEILVEYEDGTREKKTIDTVNNINHSKVKEQEQKLKNKKIVKRIVVRPDSDPKFGEGFN